MHTCITPDSNFGPLLRLLFALDFLPETEVNVHTEYKVQFHGGKFFELLRSLGAKKGSVAVFHISSLTSVPLLFTEMINFSSRWHCYLKEPLP